MPATAAPPWARDLPAELAAVNAAAPAGVRVALNDTHPFGPTRGVERYRLSNGLTILLLIDASAPVFAFQTWFRVGSRHEHDGKTGLAHLFEHLMFKGTTHLPDGEFDRILESRGASTNAATWLDWTYYRESLPAGDLGLVAGLEADRMVNLRLDPDQVGRELEVVKNERQYRVDDDPDGTLFERLYATAFEVHPYGRPTIGHQRDLETLSLADCRAFYAQHYAPNNATVVVVGDVGRIEALNELVRAYGPLEARPVPPPLAVSEPPQRAERRVTLPLPIAAPKLLLGYRAPPVSDPQFPAIEALNEILFEGDSARLHQRLVLQDELAIAISGWPADTREPGLLEVFVMARPGVAPDAVLRALDEEIAQLAAAGPSEREVEKAQNRLEADFLRSLESASDRARALGTYETEHDDYRALFRVADAYRALTAADIRAAAATWLVPAQRSLIIGLPNGEAPADDDGAADDDALDLPAAESAP